MIHEMRISSIDAPSIDVGIREEICLNDANIGLDSPSHQVKNDGKRYSIEPKPYAVSWFKDL